MKGLFLALFLPVASFAQGTFQFTWHGNSNHFQASFILTAAEMQSGAGFSSPDFTNSIQADSLSGISYNLKDNPNFILGGVNPWSWEIALFDFNRGTEIFLNGGEPPRGGMAGTIEEKPMSGSDLFFERGFWTVTEIPEPSVAALSGLGLLMLKKSKA
jgi:hypothetical protein